MRPLGIVGWVLVVAGIIVLALGGISFIKERDSAQVGPLEVSTVRRGFIPPIAGVAGVLVGIVLIMADRRRRT